MDFLTVLSSINKISLVAFFAVFAVLIYEIVLFKKDSKKKTKPLIPQFNTDTQAHAATSRVLITQKNTKHKTLTAKRLGMMFLGGFVILSMISVFVIGRVLQDQTSSGKTAAIQPLKTKAADITPPILTPSVTESPLSSPTVAPEVVVTPEPTTDLKVEPTAELIALNNQTATPVISLTISPTVKVENTQSPTADVSPTAISSLPITGNSSFTVMAIGISGIIVLLSFVF